MNGVGAGQLVPGQFGTAILVPGPMATGHLDPSPHTLHNTVT